ncbi:hypothetical protein OOK44_35490 [Streptomyces cellulosae]|uniref:Uncharacterized protein n=2 Tax=Streptomyces TaxID=1883 RepID=A0ABZ1YG85_9ACTN|nr:hypothetical protein [Streptomyces cellulosae]WTB86480.1 hypothetical protein OG837_34960 [Streptomyces cellulosae]WTB93306.1 hypothetical protein OIE99_34240 [Streptomyces cellulosae]WTC60698.1 hypothetical protein OH715_35995 [Streptomyces cellulosae]
MPRDLSPAAQTIELPKGWTLTLTPALNLTSLTLRDGADCPRQHGFHPGPLPAELADRQPVRRLADIRDRELRASAEQLVADHLERVATAQANADAFGAQFPDLVPLLDGLASEVPGCRNRMDVDPDRLTVQLSLTTDAPGSGTLLELVNSWLGPEGLKCTTDGLSLEFDGPSRTLAVTLDQDHAAGFLLWLRDRSA